MSTTNPMTDVVVRPGSAERLSRMIQLPTVSAELEARGSAPFEAFVDLLAELYPLTHATLERERITDFGLLFRWRGAHTADPVVLMAHYDVVPVDESDDWTHPPFAGHIDETFVYGRGALDDKGPLLVTIEAIENLLAAGWTPPRDVYLSFNGNEEVFGTAAREVARVLQERKITPWLVLDEGGAVTDSPLPFVPGRAAVVGIGEKGVMTVELSARGDAGHASAPPALTAVGRLARAVDRLTPSTFRPRAPLAIGEMLGRFATRASGITAFGLRALSKLPPVTARVFARMGGEPAAMVRTTIAPTMMSGGTASNVLPSQAKVTVNLRVALGESTAAVARRLTKRIGDPAVKLTVLEADEPSPASPVDNEQFALITAAVGASHPDALTVPYVMMAATDSRHLHRFSPAVYRFAPLSMNAELRATIHGVDERVEISELARGELFHRTLLLSLT